MQVLLNQRLADLLNGTGLVLSKKGGAPWAMPTAKGASADCKREFVLAYAFRPSRRAKTKNKLVKPTVTIELTR
jgi:hypothetical protein